MAKDVRATWLRKGKPKRYRDAGFQHLGSSHVDGELDSFLMSRLKARGVGDREPEFSFIIKYLPNISLLRGRTAQKEI